MSDYPYKPIRVDWKRPDIDRETLRRFMKRSDFKGLWHCVGVLAVLTASGGTAYYMYATQRWVWMAVALYVHGGLHAFNPQTHELAHGTVFKTAWLNSLFKRIFGLVHWTNNSALYWMSHTYHHRYTLHRQSEGEEVHPRPETTEQLLHRAVQVVNLNSFITSIYDQIYSLFKPFLRNPRRSIWQRYTYEQSSESARRDVRWTQASQFLFHVAFAAAAIATGHWFLIVVVTLPGYYGGKWYAMWVHDTMHVGCEPETDDFRLCCRSVRVNPFTSFMYWHMEYHTEHHTYPGMPCYNLKKFHEATREHWDPPKSLFEAWREMNRHSEKLLAMPPREEVEQPA